MVYAWAMPYRDYSRSQNLEYDCAPSPKTREEETPAQIAPGPYSNFFESTVYLGLTGLLYHDFELYVRTNMVVGVLRSASELARATVNISGTAKKYGSSMRTLYGPSILILDIHVRPR